MKMHIMRTKLSFKGLGFSKIVASSHFVPRLAAILALLTLGGVAAQARGPVFTQATNVIIMPQGTSTNFFFSIQDDAVGWSGIQTTTAAFVTNGIFSNSILTITNFSSPYGPPQGWTNAYSMETNRLTISPGNQFGTNQIILVSVDLWGDSNTNRYLLQVYHVSQPPSFSLKTNQLVVMEESGKQTNSSFVTGITNGAGNLPGLTWSFTTTTSPTTLTNGVTFVTPPSITNYNGSNGLTADLVFAPTNHSFGSNLVTVVMTDSGPVSGGGTTTRTNTFWLVVAPIVHPPVFGVITNQIAYENSIGLTNVIISVSGDSPGSTLTLKALSQNTNLALVSVTKTNVVGLSLATTNTQFTLSLTPAWNTYGIVTNTLIANEVTANTNYFTTNYLVFTVTHVSQPPSFTLATNSLVVLEESLAQTNVNFVTNIIAGAGNPAGTLAQFKFAISTATTNAGNAQFAVLPAFAVTNGVLTFTPKPHSFGTNLVTLTMTNTLESTNYGGVTTFTTNFLVKITQISHLPTITAVTMPTLLENAGASNLFVNVWNFDAISNNLALVAVSQNTNLASVAVTFTNVASATNTIFTLRLSPLTNTFGTNPIALTASALVGTTNVSTNSFSLMVAHVSQAPRFVFATNNIAVLEQATATLVSSTNFLTAMTNGAGNLPGPGTNWTFTVTAANKGLFGTNTQPAVSPTGILTFTPLKLTNGTTAVTVVMTDQNAAENTSYGGVITFTNAFTLALSPVSLSPSFAVAASTLTVPEHFGLFTSNNFLTSITTGLTNPAGLPWTFTVSCPTNGPGNVTFAQFPSFTTNGTLTFAASDYSYGTNPVTIVMSIVNGGFLVTFTNSFTLQVPWINQAPSFALGFPTTTVDKFNVPITLSNAAINILAGPANETNSQTVAFHVSNNNTSLFSVQPAIDPNGTLTFTPRNQPGIVALQIYAQDSGGTANGGVNISSNQMLTLVIPTNTFQNVAGTYAGVFYGTNALALASSGYFSLAIDTNGAFTGYLLCGNDSNTYSGQFDISNYFASVTSGNYALNVTAQTLSQSVSGFVTNTAANWGASMKGCLSGYSSALDDTYLLVLPGFNSPKAGSLGDSVFNIGVSGGVATVAGNLADSNQVTQTSSLCTNGYLPVYIPLYTNSTGANGLLIGWVNLNNVDADGVTVDSDLIWISATNATALYPKGFTNNVAPVISTYDATLPQLLPIDKGYVEMSGGTLSIPIVQAVSVVDNQIIPDPSTGDNLSLTINSVSGAIQGTFVDSNGNTNQVVSVILQDDGVARGYFQSGGQSGSFILVDSTYRPYDPPYPAFTAVTPGAGIAGSSGVTAAGITNLTVLENAPTNNMKVAFTLYDPLTNGFTVASSSVATNIVSVYTTGTNGHYVLWFAPVTNQFGSNLTVTVTADDGIQTNVFDVNLTVALVNHAPSFTLATNAYYVSEYDVAVSIPNAITSILAGPPSESGQTVAFNVSNNQNGLFTVQPAVDANGTLTFTPNNVGGGTVTVQVAAQDNGGTANGGVDTSAPQTITLTIPTNPFSGVTTSTNNTGTFTGLFSDTNSVIPTIASAGYFNLTLANDGSYTGYVLCAGTSNNIAGEFDASAFTSTATVANYTLSLVLDPVGATVTGSAVSSSPSWTATLQSYLAAAPALAGNYLVAMQGVGDSYHAPDGDSVFSVAIDTNGVATLAGHMGDNTPVSLVSQVSAGGNCPIYTPLYTNGISGLLIGWLDFTNAAADNATAASTLTWIAPAGATPHLYAYGFTNQSVAVASTYSSNAPNALLNISHYAVMTGSGLIGYTNPVTIANNVITADPSGTIGLSLNIIPGTGEIQGSFVNGGQTNYIESVILQNTNVARGYFISADGTSSGSIVLLNNYAVPANYAYPEVTGLTNLTLLENAPGFSMAFTFFDPLADTFTSVTAVSADPNVATVSVTGTGTAYTLLITPVTDTFTNGMPISIVANDGTLISTNTLTLTVTWVNQAPTFTLNPTTLVVDEFDAPIIISNAVTAISAGPDNGGGTVNFIVTNNANSLFVTQPAVDANGTLTFTPGNVGGTVTVGVQGHDNMGTANGGVDTSVSQMFTVSIPVNQFQTLTGTNVSGTFMGLFYDTNDVIPSSSGYVSLTLTNDGTFNLGLVSVGATNWVIGQFSISNSTASVAVTNYGLNLTIDTDGGTIAGSVTNTTAHWNAELQTYLAAIPAVAPGTYIVTLPGCDSFTQGPVGYSVFNVGISSNGVATLAGSLADNTPVNQVALLSTTGYCPVYIPLYPNGTNGLLMGWICFTNDPAYDSLTDNSSLTWFNAAGATTNLYAGGFTNQTVALASPYATNADYQNDLLGSSSATGFGYVMLSGGDLGADPVVKKVAITNNIISVVPSSDQSISLNINTNSGLIQGWYIDTKGYSNNIQSAIFQNDAFSSGYFIGVNTNQSGLFMLFGN
jgi:hypothetical protein